MRSILAAASALLVTFAIVACDSSTSSNIPSGTEPPILFVTVISGTKTAPVDSPTAIISWQHQDSVAILIDGRLLNDTISNDPHRSQLFAVVPSSGSKRIKFYCQDSIRITVTGVAWKAYSSISAASIAYDSSKIAYCK